MIEIKCVDVSRGKTIVSLDVGGVKARQLVTIVEGALVAILAYERPLKELEWEIPGSLYEVFEKSLGWIPEEGRHDRLFGIKAYWIGKENEA